MSTNLIYKVNDKPPFKRNILFAFQQLLAILAATIAVPMIVNNNTGSNLSQAAALFGAGVGTLVYLLFTKFKSPVFLGSSFAFLGSMTAAFSGAYAMEVGYLGLILGAILAGLLYVIIAVIVKHVGVDLIEKLMPPIIIGPTVAVIGLSLAGNAITDLQHGALINGDYPASPWLALVCGLTALLVTVFCSVKGKKMVKMIPFIIGIGAGYLLALIISIFGYAYDLEKLKIINFALFKIESWIPDFTFLKAFAAIKKFESFGEFMTYFVKILFAYAPVAFVVFAEHIADHKNLGSIIDANLLEEPGLEKTLLGDGIGSMTGAFFGGCPNTTYGESVGCVAISGNASTRTILLTSIVAIIASFIAPFIVLLSTIPPCVMGGICMALYGFIAVSGLRMLQNVDLSDNRNLFVVASILIAGVGGLVLSITNKAGKSLVEITEVASALIIGIIVNLVVRRKEDKEETKEIEKE